MINITNITIEDTTLKKMSLFVFFADIGFADSGGIKKMEQPMDQLMEKENHINLPGLVN